MNISTVPKGKSVIKINHPDLFKSCNRLFVIDKTGPINTINMIKSVEYEENLLLESSGKEIEYGNETNSKTIMSIK